MKRVTASEARKNWFRLLDEVVRGEVVVLERSGKRIVVRTEDEAEAAGPTVPSYRELLQVPDMDEADRWGWEWPGPEQDLVPRIAAPERER